MIADQIKENTHAQHQSLEALMIRQIKSIKDAGDYIELLLGNAVVGLLTGMCVAFGGLMAVRDAS